MNPRRLLPWLVVATIVVLVLTALTAVLMRDTDSSPTPQATTAAKTPAWRAILAEWDTARADAWATGDLSALRALYVEDSVVGRRDASMLRAYVERDLVVRGLATQVLAAELVSSRADRLVVRATDRVVGGRVTSAGASQGTALPRDRATTRRLEFRRVAGTWLLAGVSSVRRPALR